MRIATPLLALLVLTGAAAGARVHVTLAGRPPVLTAGTAWTAKLTVRPASFTGSVRVKATGPGRVTALATGRKGSYRVRLVFPKAGRWTLSALAGGSTSRLGALTVRRRAEPLAFAYPTSVAVEASGSLLVVENGAGRIWRVDPATGVKTLVASNLSRPYSVAVTAAGEILLATENTILNLGSGSAPVVAASSQIGPLATASNGDLYFTISTAAYRLPSGAQTPVPIAEGLAVPHGIAVMADGGVLVSDTEHDRILRVEPSGAITPFAQMNRPGGLAIARDGSVYACDALVGRIAHFSASGASLGFLGDFFAVPYALAVAPDGGAYVAEAEASGHIKHVAPDGTVTTLSSH
jgi:hypothetical protein